MLHPLLSQDHRMISQIIDQSKLSLIFERILFYYLFPKAKKIIKPQHHGFLKSRNTVSQIITYLDLLYANPDNNLPCLFIYFDIEKAFDSVSHHLLLTKLCTLGFDFDFISLFTFYLNDRRQYNKLENTLSNLSNVIDVTSGVPHGSVLGPLFLLFFIDDLPDEAVSSVYFLFCDDLKLQSSSSIENIQRDIDTLSECAKLNSNRLSFHSSKSKILSFGSTLWITFQENLSRILKFWA